MTSRTTEDSRTALITGASSGIGLELARTLAANGHSLVIVARDEARLKAVAAQLESDYGVPVTWHAKDLSEPRAADDLWSDLSKANIIIDVLVNNAGVGLYGDFQDESLDAVRRMQMINVVALTTLTRLALPGMLARHRGRPGTCRPGRTRPLPPACARSTGRHASPTSRLDRRAPRSAAPTSVMSFRLRSR